MPLGSPDRMDGATGIGFFENGHNLRFGELRLAHGNPPGYGDYCARKFSVWTVSVEGERTL